MSKLLLVEDDSSLGETLRERLFKEGYSVRLARTLVEAEKFFREELPDLVILDVGLPDGSGFDLAERLKKISQVPFIFVTARGEAENRLKGYELGAEEYIPKPFHLREILLRVRHVLDNHAVKKIHNFSNVQIDCDSLTVTHIETGAHFLSAKDMQLLKLLIESAPKVLSRDEILNQVWGEEKFPTPRTVDNAIVRLRQVLGEQASEWLRSVRGIGYQWAEPDGRNYGE